MTRLKIKKDENGNYIEHSARGYEVTGDYFYVDDIMRLYSDGRPMPDDDGSPRFGHDIKKLQ